MTYQFREDIFPRSSSQIRTQIIHGFPSPTISSFSDSSESEVTTEDEYLVLGNYRVCLNTIVRQGKELDSTRLRILPMGSRVHVVGGVGRRVQIDSPCRGWCSIISSLGDVILSPLDEVEIAKRDLKHEKRRFEEKTSLEINRVKDQIAELERYLIATGCSIPEEAPETIPEDLFDYDTNNIILHSAMDSTYVHITEIVADLFDEETERIINSFLYDFNKRSEEEIKLRVDIYKIKIKSSSRLSDLNFRLKQLAHVKNSHINSVELKENLIKLQELDEIEKKRNKAEANEYWWGGLFSIQQIHEAFASMGR